MSMSRQKEDPVFNRVEELRVAKGLTRQQRADAVGVVGGGSSEGSLLDSSLPLSASDAGDGDALQKN